MSSYGQQPPAHGQPPNRQQPNPYAQPTQPYSQPGQPARPQPVAGQVYGQPAYGAQASPYGRPDTYPPSGQAPQQGPPYGAPSSWPPQPGRPRPGIVRRAIPVVTMDNVPGRRFAAVVGDVVGVVARFRELPPELRGGDPIDGYAVMLARSRQEAVTRLVDMAVAAGADAVVGLRYDCSEITQMLSEVSAYGTAVRLLPESGAGGGSAEGASQGAGPVEREQNTGTSPTPPGATAIPTPQADDESDTATTRIWPATNWPSQS